MKELMESVNEKNTLKALRNLAALIGLLIADLAVVILIMTVLTHGWFWTAFISGKLGQEISAVYVGLLYFLVLYTIIRFWNVFSGESIITTGLVVDGKSPVLFIAGLITGLTAFLLYFIPLILAGVTSSFQTDRVISQILDSSFIPHIIINAVACFAIAVTEEMVFRGVILNIFLRSSGRMTAVIFSSVFFAFCHMFTHGPWIMKFVYFITLVFFGAVLSLTCIKTKSLWWAIGLHFSLIYLVLVKNYLKVFDLKTGSFDFLYGISGHPMAGLWSIIVFISMILIIKGINPDRNEKIRGY